MGRRPAPIATDAELELLRLLWDGGPATVRELQEALERVRPTGYTTVLKLLQIMTERGLVRRDETRRAHVYRAAVTEASIQKKLLGTYFDKVFAGSTSALVMRALALGKASRAELREIRRMLDERERGTR